MSASQNIFDDPVFFASYRQLRERDDNHNILIEQPAMARLIPNLEEMHILDLGCGCGGNCLDFVHRGAHHVLGIDLSEKMLAAAREEASNPRIEYRRMDLCDLSGISEQFDMVYSSLAFDYIEDISKLFLEIYDLLKPGGILLFSQEHPLNTADGFFNRNEAGERVSYTSFDYNRAGKKSVSWFVDGVEKYHRPMGEILTAVARAGFFIETVCEPVPSEEALTKRPELAKEYIEPCFLIVRARKA